MNAGQPNRKFIVSLDYGTTTCAAAYRVASSGEPIRVDTSKISDVMFRRDIDQCAAPQQFAWAADGTFHWGMGLEQALNHNTIPADLCFELVKLLLYKGFQDSEIAVNLRTRLEARSPNSSWNNTIVEAIAQHLRSIIAEIKLKMKSDMLSQYTNEDVDALPMEVFLSVPEMWRAPANRIMAEAARLAGLEKVQLIGESECSAAFCFAAVQDWKPTKLKIGQTVLVADIGGGTGDFSSYTLQTSSEEGASIQLIDSGFREGELCGSEFINQEFLKWWRKKTTEEFGSLPAACIALKLTTANMERKASRSFEEAKIKFTHPLDEPRPVAITAGADAQRNSWTVVPRAADMVGFFEPIIVKIEECIRRQLARKNESEGMLNTTWIVVPGGFGRSTYLIDRLRRTFKGIEVTAGSQGWNGGAFQPVARGALLRYNHIIPQGFPSTESFGIGRTEHWDPLKHPDATESRGELERSCNPQLKPIMTMVERDEDSNGHLNVYERWTPILKIGEFKKPGQKHVTATWQYHIVDLDQTEISVQVYWTENDIPEHGPILNGSNKINSGPKEGIEAWGNPIVMLLPDFAELGFEQVQNDNGDLVYQFFSRMTLECDGADVKVGWEIASSHPFDEEGEPNNDWDGKIISLKSAEFALSMEAFNTNVRRGHE